MIKIKCPYNLKTAKKKEINFISFVDLDGVLTNWLDATAKLCKIDVNDKEIRDELKKGTFIDDLGIVSEDELWQRIESEETDFWARLEEFPWTQKLVEELEKISEVYFLTSPGSCVPAPSGKMEWIKNHFGEEYITKLIICKDKYICASDKRILVDDSKKKIDKFREYGGHVFLWPNCYVLLDEEKDWKEAIDELKEEIKKYKN